MFDQVRSDDVPGLSDGGQLFSAEFPRLAGRVQRHRLQLIETGSHEQIPAGERGNSQGERGIPVIETGSHKQITVGGAGEFPGERGIPVIETGSQTCARI